MECYLADEAATVGFGEKLSRALNQVSSATVYLDGDLGAGKTTLTRGILHALGHSGAVKSPTYTLVEPYELGEKQVFHFDLYRLGDPEELEYMGIRDYFTGDSLCLVEWWQKGQGVLPEADLHIELTVSPPGRTVAIAAISENGRQILQNLRV